jgi:hypothetical protein
MLLEILPEKVNQTVDDVLSGFHQRTTPLWYDRVFSHIFEIEKPRPANGAGELRFHLPAMGAVGAPKIALQAI